MSTAKQLITHINNISNTKYIKKNIQTFIKDNMELIKDHTNDQETKQINDIIKLISNQDLKASNRFSIFLFLHSKKKNIGNTSGSYVLFRLAK